MFLNLPRDVIRSTARFRLCAHTLQDYKKKGLQSRSMTARLFVK